MTTIFYEARVYHAVDMFAEADNLRYYWVATIRVPRALRYPTVNTTGVTAYGQNIEQSTHLRVYIEEK